MIEEPEELQEAENPLFEPKPHISFEESTMDEEREGELHNVNGEQPRIGEGNMGGGIGGGRGRGRGEDINLDPFVFLIVDEDTTMTMKNISPSILSNCHGIRSEDP